MNLVYKKDGFDICERIIKQLREQYANKKFRIYNDYDSRKVSIEEKIGFMKWIEIDLMASGLLKDDDLYFSRYL